MNPCFRFLLRRVPLALSVFASMVVPWISMAQTGEEGRLKLKIPEVVVVGRGTPTIRVETPRRRLPRKLLLEKIAVGPSLEDTPFPPVSVAFDPGSDFTPKLPRPDSCYEGTFSARRIARKEGAPAHFRIGYLAFLDKDFQEAEEEFQTGLGKNPDAVTSSFLYYWLGELRIRNGKRAEAKEIWKRVARDPAGPLAGTASFQIGLMAYREKNFPVANRWLERVAERFPGHPQSATAAFLAGEMSLRAGELSRAAWLYAGVRQAAKGSKTDELLRLAAFREGTTLYRLGRLSEVPDPLRSFFQFPGADEKLLVPAQLALGWSYYHVQRYEDARSTFSELSKDIVSPKTNESAEASLGWLLSALSMDREDEAREAWTILRQVRPINRFTLWGALALGNRFYESGWYRQTVQLLGDFPLKLNKGAGPKFRDLLLRTQLLRAFSLYSANNPKNAAAAFQLVLNNTRKTGEALRPQALYGLVLARLAAGDPKEAAALGKSFTSRFRSSPLVPEIRYWRGEALLRLKRYVDARKELAAIPANHLRIAEAALGRAYSYYGQRQWREASSAFRRAASLLKQRPALLAEAMLRQGEARFNAKDYEGAEKTFQTVLKDFSKSPTAETASLRLGEMFFQRAEFSRAEAEFAGFLRRWPQSPRRDQALYWTGKTQIRRRQFVLARVSLERLVRDFPKSRYRLAALLEIGNAYYNEGRFQESSAAYRRVLTEKPSSDEAREARYGMVLTRLRSGNTEDFIRDVRSFIQKEKDPKLVNALEFQVGEIFLAQKRYPAALAAYLRVLRRGGEGSDVAHYRIGEIKQLEGKPAEAAEYFRDLLQKFPDSRVRGDARFRLAESLRTSGDCGGAMREYRAFIQENPDHSLLAQGRYGAGACALRLKDKDTAETFFSQVVQGGGSGSLIARSHYELGRIAREKGRFAVSLNHMRSALKGGVSRSLHPRIQFELGSLHQSLKQYPRAVVEFLKVAYLYPREKALGSQALLRVAGIYELQGKKAKALQLYGKVVKESPTPSVRKLAQDRIGVLRKALKSKPAGSGEKTQ